MAMIVWEGRVEGGEDWLRGEDATRTPAHQELSAFAHVCYRVRSTYQRSAKPRIVALHSASPHPLDHSVKNTFRFGSWNEKRDDTPRDACLLLPLPKHHKIFIIRHCRESLANERASGT